MFWNNNFPVGTKGSVETEAWFHRQYKFMAILLPTTPECNQKGHKKGEEGREKDDQCLISTVFTLCPLWPFVLLHLHTGIFFQWVSQSAFMYLTQGSFCWSSLINGETRYI